ncbi:MAG: single-stranded DNA-binding protein [Clostridiales bacterium]|nr:single-stranded DNA-binding protein [Clostridiales bacterium]
MNRVILMGRLTRDPELRYSQGDNSMAIARFTVAVDRRGRRNQDGGDQQQTADFIGCTAFGRTAEFIQKYFTQGRRILLQGRIQTGSYTNREGQRVYTTDVIVDEVEFCDSKNSEGGAAGSSYNNNYNNYQQTSRPAPSSAIGDGFMNIPDGVEDEGLPFN